MKLKVMCVVSLIGLNGGNLCSQQHRQSPSALEELATIAVDSDDMVITAPNPIPMAPVTTEEKGIPNNIDIIINDTLGNPPNPSEKNAIMQALDVLNGTKMGREICARVGSPGCTLKDNTLLNPNKIEFTTRDLSEHLLGPIETSLAPYFGDGDPWAATPKPSCIKGRTIVCLDKKLLATQSSAYVAHFIAHELSHVSDNRNKENNIGETIEAQPITKYAAEYKAILLHMMVVDELLRTGKLKMDVREGIQFLLSVYRWKNGGPKPNMRFAMLVNGKQYNGAKLIAEYAPPGTNALTAIWRLTKVFGPKFKVGSIDAIGLSYRKGIDKVINEIETKYQAWFPSKPPVVVTPPTIPPSNGGGGNGGGNNGGDSGGSGGNGGGAGSGDDDDDDGGGDGDTINPGNPCPNPHFDPITGQASCY